MRCEDIIIFTDLDGSLLDHDNFEFQDIKDFILNKLQNLYNIKIIQKHYFNLTNNNLSYLNNKTSLCCLRSNGNPYYVFFTLYNDIPIIYYIDKKIHPNYQKPRIILVRGFLILSILFPFMKNSYLLSENLPWI